MKKILFIAVVLIIVVTGMICVYDGEENRAAYKNIKEINSENYKQKIEERENFILYVYSDSCKYCDKFKRVFADMLLKNNNMCYEIEYLENKDVLDEKIGEKNQGTPAVYFYINGEIKDYFIGTQDSSVMSDYLQKYDLLKEIEVGGE